jgi:cytochrome c-type biogenesis protein CcmH
MRVWAAVCLALAMAIPVAAADVEQEARAIEAMLVAPCCWSQQVSVHQSEAANEIKKEVRASLEAGRTRQQILDAYVAKYGTRILIQPPAEGFNATLYVLPIVALVFSAGGVAWIVRRLTRKPMEAERPAAPADTHAEPADGLQARLEEELDEMD